MTSFFVLPEQAERLYNGIILIYIFGTVPTWEESGRERHGYKNEKRDSRKSGLPGQCI